ncbi:hypothetical protein ADL25_16870 [Streptomyces sp. NRRL F-5122]|nr:hypothetical protein ADL25_16870 [Streptomyces sp. NRRL F-5122]
MRRVDLRGIESLSEQGAADVARPRSYGRVRAADSTEHADGHGGTGREAGWWTGGADRGPVSGERGYEAVDGACGPTRP